jgi:hypothetical protein
MPLWRRGLASARIRSANGAIASSPSGSRGSTTRCVAAGHARWGMRRLPSCSPRHSLASPRPPPIGACALWPERPGLPRAVSIVCSSCSVCNLTVAAALSSRLIPSSSRSCATWSGFILTRPTRQWCFASMRRARSKRSNAPSPCFPWGSLHRGRHP